MAGVEFPEIPRKLRKPRKRGFPGPKIPAPPIRGEDSGGDFRELDGRQQGQTAAQVEDADQGDDWPTVRSIIPAAGAVPVKAGEKQGDPHRFARFATPSATPRPGRVSDVSKQVSHQAHHPGSASA